MPKNVTITPRISEIAAKIRGACLAIVEPHGQMVEHQDAVKELSGTLQATRLSVALEIAEMSSVDKWLPGEIEVAVKHAAKSSNDPDNEDRSAKTLATFMSEMRVVASPKVRDLFPCILQSVEDAWDEETTLLEMADSKEKASVPTPVRKYASRKYHCVLQVTRAVKDGEASITSAQDVIDYCKANDPDHDEEKVEKRLKRIVEQLQQVYHDFGNDEIKTCVEYLETISAKELLDSRRALHGEPVTPVVTQQPQAPTGVHEGARAQRSPIVADTITAMDRLLNDDDAPVDVAPAHTLIEGAYDPLAEMAA